MPRLHHCLAAALLFCAAAASMPRAGAADVANECDRLAAHPEDPQRISAGVERERIDLPVAIAACERVLAAEPANARARYQLARILFYSNQNARAVEEMRRAADGGYAQAQFVFGTFITRSRPGAPTDPCLAESYWRRSAAGGRQAARVQYLRFTLQGRFAACRDVAPEEEQLAMLEAATSAARDFYETLLVEDIGTAFAARAQAAPAAAAPAGTSVLGKAAQAAWQRCAKQLGAGSDARVRERRLGVTPESTRNMYSLILSGEKTITTTSPWLYDPDPSRRPVVGGYSVLLDADGTAAAVLRTTEVKELPFDRVTAEDSRYEGQPIRPLAAWRELHVRFFGRELESLGRKWAADMPVTLERFEVACRP
ncbi:MAG: ASCH domain-containing protein [Gammaproteobacteria bacterium]|nr:ASCH domain-containing protein [Gammaproteobacteria bacterium]